MRITAGLCLALAEHVLGGTARSPRLLKKTPYLTNEAASPAPSFKKKMPTTTAHLELKSSTRDLVIRFNLSTN